MYLKVKNRTAFTLGASATATVEVAVIYKYSNSNNNNSNSKRNREFIVERITVVKFAVNDRGSNGKRR